jgi:methylthioribose-1-phosphate isomerase
MKMAAVPEAVRWAEDGRGVDILDQTLLPEREQRVVLQSAEEVAQAITDMRVRGAPAIGIAAAMGVAVEMKKHAERSRTEFRKRLHAAARMLMAARPTAVNLSWAVRRCVNAAESRDSNSEAAAALRAEAERILEEDRDMCRRIGQHALGLFPEHDVRLLTHCNAGALATGGIGTALAPVYLAHEQGRGVHVFAPETRPLLQGSRLTAWELERAGVAVTLLPDSVAAILMRERKVDLVIVGADRIAANGDVANKVGTYALAVLAAYHGIPFYVAAPTSTLDPDTPDGTAIPIETRSADEVRRGFGRLTAPQGAEVFSPAFDVTPAALIHAIITEQGVLRPPFGPALSALRGADNVQRPTHRGTA